MYPIGARSPSLILELDLTEMPPDPSGDDRLARLRFRGRHLLRPMLRALHEAGADRRVVGLIAKVGSNLPWAGMQELRIAVAAFADSGKPTLAFTESFGEGSSDTSAYVLATAFDSIWLQPGGTLGFLGVGVETTFVRGALDKLGVQPQLEQRHEYKNAVDRLTRSGFTEAHRTALDRLTESVFTGALDDIARSRGMTPEELRRLVDSGPRTASEAHEAGLVDAVGYRDEAYQAIRERVGGEAELLYADRWRARRRPRLPRRQAAGVALVEIRGAIASGRSRRAGFEQVCGSDSVTAALRAAASDEAARAVVLLVDSPGGSAVASETIWREVCQVRATGKPVVVSMASTAASGGYFVACPADVIVALPATLTGSIGVFGGKFVTRDLLERLGLNTGAVAHGARALMYSTRRPFTDGEQERLAAAMDAVYDDFVTKVARGRQRDPEDIERVARGRVWTGSDAVAQGLVDELGGLRDALRIARARAGLAADAPVRHAPRVPLRARLQPPRNSEDPRAAVMSALPGLPGLGDAVQALGDAAQVFGHPPSAMLRMPEIRLR